MERFAAVVRFDGELDIYRAPEVREVLATLDAPACAIVDLSRVRFFDASLLSALVDIGKARSARGLRAPFIVLRNHLHRKLFAVTGLENRFGLCSSLEEAAELCAPQPLSA